MSEDLRSRSCTCATGFKSYEMYSGVRLFKALYVRTALLYLSLSGTESQQSSLNMCSDEVFNIILLLLACNIILVARFCNLDRRSICVDVAWTPRYRSESI